jgi:hypothetical protein
MNRYTAFGRFGIGCGAARKFDDAEEGMYLKSVGNPVHYGYCWFFHLPRVRTNGGRPWRNQYSSLTFQWMRFWIDLSWSRA